MNSSCKTLRPKTVFCDIDGTLVRHEKPSIVAKPSHEVKLLEGTIKKLEEWDRKGYNIILTTGRKESLRNVTVKQLSQAGIIYDQLIMGIGGGKRILINDLKEGSKEPTACAFVVERNKGISEIDI